jgi:hypothetical protein
MVESLEWLETLSTWWILTSKKKKILSVIKLLVQTNGIKNIYKNCEVK